MLELALHDRGSDVLLVARGDIDQASARRLRDALDTATASGAPLLLVDLAGVSYMDSAGLSVLMTVRRTLGEHQRLALCNVPERMQRVLGVTGVAALLELHAGGDPWPWPEVDPSPTTSTT